MKCTLTKVNEKHENDNTNISKTKIIADDYNHLKHLDIDINKLRNKIKMREE